MDFETVRDMLEAVDRVLDPNIGVAMMVDDNQGEYVEITANKGMWGEVAAFCSMVRTEVPVVFEGEYMGRFRLMRWVDYWGTPYPQRGPVS